MTSNPMSNQNFLFRFLLVTQILFQSACFMSAQDPSESFVAKEFPKNLETLINPKPLQNAITASEQRASPLSVAVIDNGVDYLHPFLKDKIRYDKWGVGQDFLGKDHYPHPYLAEVSNFAFGAKLDNGKINQYLENPFQTISQLNQAFLDELVPLILQNKNLEGTLFKKITRDAFHLFGAQRLVAHESSFRQQAQETKKIGNFLDAPEHPMQTYLPAGIKRLRFLEPWKLASPTSGHQGFPTAVAPYQMIQFRGFEEFLNVVITAYERFNQKTKYEEEFYNPYVEFRKLELHKNDRGKSQAQFVDFFTDELFTRWMKYHTQMKSSDPAYKFALRFCALLSDEDYFLIKSQTTPIETKKQILNQTIDQVFLHLTQMEESKLKSQPNDESDEEEIKESIESFKKYQTTIKQVMLERGIEFFSCSRDQQLENSLTQAYQHLNTLNAHPFIRPPSKGAADASHGTHVSGIILTQAPEAQIVPIRVITEDRLTTNELDEKMKTQTFNEFSAWLKTPLGEAVLKTRLKTQDLSRIQKRFRIIYEKNRLDFFLFNQLRDAIRYVAQEKIKIANISLQTSFEKMIKSKDEKATFENDLLALIYEFFKVSIGELLTGVAKDTVFIVAAGNNKGWIDSIVKIGLPCELSSPDLDLKLPNQRVENLLCVASIQDAIRLSSYTDIVLREKVIFAGAQGENITSAVRLGDCRTPEKEFLDAHGALPELSLTDQLTQVLFEKEQGVPIDQKRTPEQELEYLKLSARLQLESQWIESLNELVRMHACVTYSKAPQGEMSGTSMATPQVSGLLASLVIKKLKERRLNEVEAYTHSDFDPKKLIRELTGRAPKFGGGSVLKNMRIFLETKPYLSLTLP